jgi:hypothetical protein
MGKDPEAEGEHEANRERRDERRHVQHGGGPKELGPGVYHPDNERGRRQPLSARGDRASTSARGEAGLAFPGMV